MNLLWRTLYRLYRIGSWYRYWEKRRHTVAGTTVIICLLATALAGMDIDSTVGYQAFMLLLSLLVVAWGFSRFFRGNFSVTRALPRFGTAGQALQYQVTVRNLTDKPQRNLALLEDTADPRPRFEEWKAFQLAEGHTMQAFRMSRVRRTNPFQAVAVKDAAVPPLAPGGEATVTVQVLPQRRGVLRLTGATLARPDPLGLFRAFVRVRAPQTVLILPKRYPLPPLALPGTQEYQQGGVALATNVGQSDEFVSLRDYRAGDPVRHIHWRSWAKTGRPIVKEFEDEFFVRHALVLDTFADSPHSELFEEAVSVAASFACTLLTQESLLDLLFVGHEAFCFTAGRGLGQADQMLEILAAVRVNLESKFALLEAQVLEHARSVSGVVCVLLAWDAPRREFVRKLEALNVPVFTLVLVPRGQGAGLDAALLRDGPARFVTLELGRIEQDLAKLR